MIPAAVLRSTTASRIAWGIVAIVLLSGVIAAWHRGVTDRPDWDDLRFETRYVWEHGHTAPGTAMFGYLPTTTFALWPFTTWLPQPLGLALFIASNLAAALASIWIVQRWWIDSGRSSAVVWPVLLVCANFQHALQANQLTLWTLFLCVAGLTLVGRRREFAGGLVIGLATLIKTMPAVLVLYLLLRRRWWALLGVAAAVAAFDLVPSAAFFGWQRAIGEHRAWLKRAAWHSNRVLIEQPLLRVHRHGTNASLSAVLTRWLRDAPDARRQVILYGNPPKDVVAQKRTELAADECLSLDPMPPREGQWAEKRVDIGWVPRFHVAGLSASVVWWIWVTPLAIGGIALAWFTWRTGRPSVSSGSFNLEAPLAALWMLAMFWPSPMTRHYYLAWAFPAVAIVCQTLVTELSRQAFRWTPGTVLLAAALAAWLIGVAGLGWNLGRWYGLHLAVLALLTGATACAVLVNRPTRQSPPVMPR